MNVTAPVVLPNGGFNGTESRPGAPLKTHGSGLLVAAVIVSCVLLVLVATAGLLTYAALQQQRAEHAVLVRDVAVTINERDELRTSRDRLVVERDEMATAGNRLTIERDALASERDDLAAEHDRLSSERDSAVASLDAERERARRSEASLQEANARLGEVEKQLTQLRAEAEASAADAHGLREELDRLRERADLSQADARATASAGARTEAIAQAALAYSETGYALSATRSRMIDTLLEQVSAERNGRSADARRWMEAYNALVPVHNRQLADANAALERLRGLL